MASTSATIEHVGEWKVSITAETLEEVFAEIARVIARETGEAASGEAGDWENISVSARDLETLLADWANELLGRSEAEERAYAEVRDVKIISESGGAQRVSAELRGSPVDRFSSALKAATYHGLSVVRDASGWHAIILFDV